MNELVIHNIKKSFGKKQVLINIALSSSTNTITGIFGRNGCGKSTLLKILFGTINADMTEAYINEKPFMPKHNISNEHIAYLPQESFLPKSMKVRDIIPMYFQSPEKQDKIFYHKGIDRITNAKAGILSMGELRFLELILVGNLNHPFILLDEPFAMIDPVYKEHIKEYIFELKETKGIIATDHYYKDILDITDKNYIIDSGNLFEIRDINDLKKFGYLPA